MLKKILGIGLIALLVILIIYSRTEHNIKNLSYQELEEELIKIENEYQENHYKISKKEKDEMTRKFAMIMQELEERDKKERDDKKAEELIKMYKSKKAEVDFKDLGTGYWDTDLNKWVDKGSEPPKKIDNTEPR